MVKTMKCSLRATAAAIASFAEPLLVRGAERPIVFGVSRHRRLRLEVAGRLRLHVHKAVLRLRPALELGPLPAAARSRRRLRLVVRRSLAFRPHKIRCVAAAADKRPLLRRAVRLRLERGRPRLRSGVQLVIVGGV